MYQPFLLKTRRFGYDGKGQVLIKNYSDIKRKFSKQLITPSIAEEVLDFDKEISIILARDIKGKIKAFEAEGEQIGDATHDRFVIDCEKFMARVKAG